MDGFRGFVRNLVDENLSVDTALESACGYDSQTLYDRWRQTLPNAPAPGSDSSQEAPATGTSAPVQASDNTRIIVLALLGAGLCIALLSGLGILFIVIRLLRPREGSA
ncbi:MAG: hypothetical protein ACRDIB_15850 [Ardenticatenaceae bacterium]